MAKAPALKSEGFSLADLIESTANELREAEGRPKQGDAMMEFKGCEIELAVTVKGEAGGGIRFWVVDASAKVGAERISKVKLSFAPIAGGKAAQFVGESSEDDKGPPAPRRQK